MSKKQYTFSIDEKIRKNFKTECVINDDEMSNLLESFMQSYTKMSKERRNA